MTQKEAPGAVAAAAEGQDQNPTIQEENQTMHIITDDQEAHQALESWATDYATRLRQSVASAPHSVEYAQFCADNDVPPGDWPVRVLWAERSWHDIAAVALRALPIWPDWAVSVELMMLTGGEVVVDLSGREHGNSAGPVAQITGLMNIVVLPEYGRADDDEPASADWMRTGRHDRGEVTLSWSGAPDSGDADALTARAFARVLTAAADQLDEVVRRGHDNA